MALFTLAAVLVYTGVQIYQTILIHSNNITSQRAFVYVSGFSPLLGTNKDGGRLVRLFLLATNGGNTPTMDLHFFFRCAPSVESLPEPWVLLYREKVEFVPQVIGPKATVNGACDFTTQQLTDMTAGKLHGYILGEIFYRDLLDTSTKHKTQYAQEYNVSYTANPESLFSYLSSIGKHNCTDEDCPAN